MGPVASLFKICASLLVLSPGVVDARSQEFSLQLLELRPEWVELIVQGAAGLNLAIETSEDLTRWENHANLDTALQSVWIYDRDAVGARDGQRFYRARVPGLSVDEARLTWRQHGVDSYTYHFRRRCFCLPWTPMEADVTVENGQVSSVTNVVYVPSPDPSEEPPPQPDLTRFSTIDGLFAMIAEAIQHADTVVVSYDPIWGFPRHMVIDHVADFVDDEDEYWVEAMVLANAERLGFAR